MDEHRTSEKPALDAYRSVQTESGVPVRIERLRQVLTRVGLGKSSIYAKIAEGTFPKPVPLGSPHAVGWVASEVDAWIEQQIRAARASVDVDSTTAGQSESRPGARHRTVRPQADRVERGTRRPGVTTAETTPSKARSAR